MDANSLDADSLLSTCERHSVWAFAGLYFPERTPYVCRDIGLILAAMQDQFGKRDAECVISRIQYGNCHPYVSFSGYSDKHAIIALSAKALERAKRGDFNPTYWQMAHEFVHLLSPTIRNKMTVLEEGVACCFQHEFMMSHYGFDWSAREESYRQAQALVEGLLANDPYLIRAIREDEPVLARVTAELIRHHSPGCTAEIANAAVQKFYR